MPNEIILSDEQVRGMLPPGFIHDYVHYASRQTDAALLLHLGAALSLLSVNVPPNVFLHHFGGRLHANLYLMIIGPSATTRKGRVMSIAERILTLSGTDKIGRTPGSYEGLLADLQHKPQQIVFEPEFSRFLSQAKGDGYLKPLKDGYTDLYDGNRISRKIRSEHWEIPNPRLSLFAACDPSLFEKRVDPEDFTGGFYSRWVTLRVPSVRERYLDMDQPDEEMEQRLALHLQRVATLVPQNARIAFAPDAVDTVRAWRRLVDEAAQQAARQVSGLIVRSVNSCEKFAMILAADEYVSRLPANTPAPDPFAPPGVAPPTLLIHRRHVEWAQLLASAAFKCAASILDELAPTQDLRDRRNVLELIQANGGRILLSDLIFRSQMSKRRLMPILESLQAEERVGVTFVQTTEGPREGYMLRNPPQALPGLPTTTSVLAMAGTPAAPPAPSPAAPSQTRTPPPTVVPLVPGGTLAGVNGPSPSIPSVVAHIETPPTPAPPSGVVTVGPFTGVPRAPSQPVMSGAFSTEFGDWNPNDDADYS